MVREKGGGGKINGFNASNTMVPAQKKPFVREIKGKELRRRRSLNSHMPEINEKHASKEVRRF